MRKLIASLTIIGTLIPSLASAKDVLNIRHVLYPAGFCTIAQDGTRGVRLTGEGYWAWMQAVALPKVTVDSRVEKRNIERAKDGLAPMNALEEAAYRSHVMNDHAVLWYGQASDGQDAICK